MISDQRLRSAIDQMDPEADAAIRQGFTGESIDELNQVLARFVTSRDLRDIVDLPTTVHTLVDDIQVQVESFDQNRILRGQNFFNTHVGICAAALTVASLPEAYAMKSSGRILGRTQRLEGASAFKRVAETSQFVLRVMTERGLECLCSDKDAAMGTGAILRVRLMHAAIRRLIKQRQAGECRTGETDYPHNDWIGEPINQVELLYTLLCFSWVTLRAVRLAYQDVTSKEADDYIYLWGCVGVLMGLEQDLIPQSEDDANEIFEKLKALHRGRSEEGEELTQAALKVMQRMLEKKIFIPNKLAPSIALVLMQQFVDQPTLYLLNVRRLHWLERRILKPTLMFGFKVLSKVYNLFSSRLADDLKAEFGFMLLNYFASHPEEVGIAEFSMPTQLKTPPKSTRLNPPA